MTYEAIKGIKELYISCKYASLIGILTMKPELHRGKFHKAFIFIYILFY